MQIRQQPLYISAGLCKYKNITARPKTDIDNIIPANCVPRLEDKAKLPYVETFFMEVLRSLPLDCLIATWFFIRTKYHRILQFNSILIQSLRIRTSLKIHYNSILTDLLIMTERYSDQNEFKSFGVGRRICICKAEAKMELFLFIMAMIHALPEDQSEPDLEGMLGQPMSQNHLK